MEKAVLEKIDVLRCAYKEKEQAYKTEHEKLQAYVEEYLDENNIWGNKELLGDVVRILPDSRLRSRLVDCLYALHDREAEQWAVQGNEQAAVPAGGRDMGRSGVCGMPQHDPKALTMIKCMAVRHAGASWTKRWTAGSNCCSNSWQSSGGKTNFYRKRTRSLKKRWAGTTGTS